MAVKIPSFSYTGTYTSEVKGGYWYIYLKSSGEIAFAYAKKDVEVCIVGGGAGGSSASGGRGGNGGGGGKVTNRTGIAIEAGTGYSVTIGKGGSVGTAGDASTAFDVTSAGGAVDGGGRGGGIDDEPKPGNPGPDGTYAFGDPSLKRYGAGGGGGGDSPGAVGGAGGADGGGTGGNGGGWYANGKAATAGTANTGGGGGGGGWRQQTDDGDKAGGAAAAGGSGVVILRGTEDDFLPVYFRGTQLQEIYLNGEKIAGLIYGGTRLFAGIFDRLKRRYELSAATA